MDQLPGLGPEVPAPGTALAEELDKKLLVQVRGGRQCCRVYADLLRCPAAPVC